MKKEKLLEREARKRALLEIQQDKEKRKQKAHQTSSPPLPPPPASTSQPTAEEKGAFIQVKLVISLQLNTNPLESLNLQIHLVFVKGFLHLQQWMIY
jgi:hypothetical protein